MATRNTTHILKNSDIVNRPLPSTLLKGEPIVNTADGIVFLSGVTTSTNEWTPAGTGTTANFFEVGSNLYDLRLRNRITKYESISGSGLIGKFLSGTTNGFVLANISDIATSTDSYTTGATWNPNILTLKLNLGKPDVSVNISSFSALTITGTLSANTINSTTISATTYLGLPTDIYVTGGTYSAGTATFTNITGGTFNVTGFTGTDTYVSAFTYSNNLLTIKQTQGQPDLTALVNTMTGLTVNGTLSATTINGGNLGLTGGITSYSGTSNVDGQFLSGTTSGFVLGAISAITGVDTYTTGFTYTPASNTLTIKRNLGQPDLTTQINTVSGLTVSNLTSGRVVIVGASGLLSDDSGLTYVASADTLTVDGGLNVGGDAVIQGSLTVFGPSISAFTTQLYVEDNNIFLNYNPTGSTVVTSIGAGWTVQDGNGVVAGDVNLNINRLDTLTGLTAGNTPSVAEYVASTGYANRGWITQLNDIVIRSTNVTTPNGVRVLAEFDVLDGGSY